LALWKVCSIVNGDRAPRLASPHSLSRAGIGRPAGQDCQLPDAILRGKRSCRPHSRAVQNLAVAGFRARPLSSLCQALAGVLRRTRPRHACNPVSASWPFSAGSATADRGALARCHGSDLLSLRLPLAYKPAVYADTPPTFRKLFPDLARSGNFPMRPFPLFASRRIW
jgi:hypothetical protein